jgi:hypothetical protein
MPPLAEKKYIVGPGQKDVYCGCYYSESEFYAVKHSKEKKIIHGVEIFNISSACILQSINHMG